MTENIGPYRRSARSSANEIMKLLQESGSNASNQVSTELASLVRTEWALGPLMTMWSQSLTDEQLVEFRPAAKIAVRALSLTHNSGHSEEVTDTADLMAACETEFLDEIDSAAANFTFGDTERHGLMRISGRGLQTAYDAESLVENLHPSLAIIIHALENGLAPSDSFAVEDFPILSRVPAGDDMRRMWAGIALRLFWAALLISKSNATDPYGVTPFTPGSFIHMMMNDSVLHLNEAEMGSLLNVPPAWSHIANISALTAHPWPKYRDGVLSSPALILDSLAPWILAELHINDRWGPAVSSLFEERTVSLLRSHGFTAGSVSDRGVWDTTGPVETFSSIRAALSDSPPPGEIDVLAVRSNSLFLVECKSVLALAKPDNVAKKLGVPTEWQSKLRKKKDYLNSILRQNVDLSLIVVEGATALSDPSDSELPILTLEVLEDMLDAERDG